MKQHTIRLFFLFAFFTGLPAAGSSSEGNPVALGSSALKAASEGRHSEALKSFQHYFELPEKNQRLTARIFREALRCAMKNGDRNLALKMAESIPAKRKLAAEEEALASVFAAALKGVGIRHEDLPDLPEEQRSKVFLDVSNLFYLAGDYANAGRYSRTAPVKPPVYSVMTVREAPAGVSAWKNSPLRKRIAMTNDFTVYNQKAAELLIYDVNAQREKVSMQADGRCPLSFAAVADIHGLSLYAEMPEKRAEEVAAGLLSGGMLEMYLQPGEGEFYYQWLWSFFPEKISFQDWISPHKHYRPLKNGFRKEVFAGDGKILLYQHIPWEVLYDRLPENGTLWTLGFIPWLRSGGFTWGSGGQVHELNKFGKLKFSEMDRILPEIRRRLLLAAWASYKKSVPVLKSFWSDEFHGDLLFYKQILVPFLERLDAYGKSVSPEMSGPEVDRLFREAVPLWFETRYYADDLRRDYLRERLTKRQAVPQSANAAESRRAAETVEK